MPQIISNERTDRFSSCGFETKTKQGNKQWVSDAAAALKSRRRKQRRSLSKSQVVNVMGAQYVMATSGKSLKRVAVSPGNLFCKKFRLLTIKVNELLLIKQYNG